MKLEKLTPEQTELMYRVRDEWMNLCLHSGKDLKVEEVREGINWIYKKAGFNAPRIIIVDSPLGAQLVANLLKNQKMRASVWDSVRDSVGGSVGGSVWT